MKSKIFINITSIILLLVMFFSVFPNIVKAALPSGFEIQTVASGLSLPTSISFAPDGRIFIAEKGGSVRVVKNGILLTQPVITLSDVNSYGDRGLIGIAVDPNFSQNGYLYLSYTYENTPGLNFSGIKTGRIVRVTVVGDVADESTKTIILGSIGGNVNTPSCDNYAITSDCIASDSPSHSVGGLRFGPDGKLYATTGDGAHFDYADSRSLRAQNLDSLAGKVLRINTDGTGPTDNPFYNGNPNSNRSKVYAYGVRNAFRFNFRPSNGSLYASDVGWSSWEEINKITAGGNYGWPCREGNVVTSGGLGCTAPGFINPLYVYAHDANGAGSVTGGSFPTGSAYPSSFADTFFFGDYAQNWIKTMTVSGTDTSPVIANFGEASDGTNGPVEFLTGPEGNVYFLSIYTGELRKITHTSGNRQPIAQISATPTNGLAPLNVSFSSTGSNDPDGNPITFLWNFGDNATSSLANPNHVYSANGSYNATLTVSDNQGGQQTKSILITVGNRAPTANITSPTIGYLYTPGNNITLTGNGTDPENGNLPNSSLSWRVILHHNTHTHILETHVGNNIVITAPDHGDPDVYTEIELTVTDSGGLTNKKSVNIYLNNGGGQNGNLIDNPSLETADPQNPGNPAQWTQDWWGVLTPIFTYPAPGYEGENLRGAKVQITQYTSGDAKWQFTPISTQENTTYSFSDYYQSNTPSTLVVQIGYINGTHSYINLGTVPTSANWTKITKVFTTPPGAKNLTVFHLLESVGSLSVDDYSLTVGTTTPDTTAPLVAITSPTASSTVSGTVALTASSTDNVSVAGVKFLVDGVLFGSEDTSSPYSINWNTASTTNGAHNVRAVSRDTAGNVATSSIVSVTVSNETTSPNLISNGSLETANGTIPLNWSKGGWGTNTRVLTYPTVGFDGGKAARVEITSYPANGTGDAKWVHAKVPITPGTQYTYSDRYKSNIVSDIIGEYTLNNGTLHYFGLAKEIPPSTTWQTVSGTFTPPSNATQVTFYHLISSVGFVEIDDVKMFVTGTSTPSETVPPVVEFTNPLNGQTVFGNVNLTASSSDNVAVTYIFYALDGTPITGQITQSPYNFTWNTASTTNGAHLLKATTHDPSGNNSTATITVIVNNSGTTTPDTTAPLVAITSPTASSTVSGTVALTASSTDNVSVAGVKFLVDGVLFGSEDTSSPYSINWNTASTTNGAHNVRAVSRDTAGNVATSSIVNIIVDNTVVPPLTNNLILNPSVETAGTNPAIPSKWTNGRWGTNTTTFTYPTTGFDGVKAASINMTAYTSGDAKWFFDDVAVTPGQQYVFSEYYKSNVVTNVTVRFKSNTGAFTYLSLGNPAVANSWTQRSNTITIPSGVVSMTVFHIIKAVGTLDIDNYSLSIKDTQAPTVSVTAPTASSTISNTVTLSATANDNIGITQVQFMLDGLNFGSPDTTNPYSISFDTNTIANGNHNISAVAKDVGGNTATSTPINVFVSNAPIGDTTSPIVSIVDPINNSTKSGLINVSVIATDNVAITDVVLSIDNINIGNPATTSPYNFSIDTNLYSNGAHSIKAIATDTSSNTASSTINVVFNNVAIDTEPPVVSIISPTNSSTITGTTTIQISATDNVGVASVHFFIDGIDVLTDTTAPFVAFVDTTNYPNGIHSITAYAKDLADNIGNATPIQVTINNQPVTPPSSNLILNPSLETVSINADIPENWFKGGWGTNDAVYTYPTVGNAGLKSAKVSMTSWTDGDAKWFFKDVNVTENENYTFREQYKSDIETKLVARFTYPDNSVQYREIANIPASINWTNYEQTIVIPIGAVKMTLFHILAGVGFLEIDDYYLNLSSVTPPLNNKFTQGMVSLTFDDGWISHYENALPILNSANLKGGFYIITEETLEAVPNNRVFNGNFEIVDLNIPDEPSRWDKGFFGNNTTVFTYPTSGMDGSGARIDITNYVDGDAKWIFDDATVISNQWYTYSDNYRSDVLTTVLVRFTYNDNSVSYQWLGDAPASGTWNQFKKDFLVPQNLKSLTVFHFINQNGFLEIDNVNMDRVPVFVNPTQVQALKNSGHEVGSHTKTHPYLTTLTTPVAQNEIIGSKTDLETTMAIGPINTFVYPYGDYNVSIKNIVANAGYTAGRSVDRGYNEKNTDKFALKVQQVDRTTTLSQFQTWVDSARNDKTWLILMFHQVDENPEATLGVSPALLQQMVNFLVTEQVNVVKMGDGILQMI